MRVIIWKPRGDFYYKPQWRGPVSSQGVIKFYDFQQFLFLLAGVVPSVYNVTFMRVILASFLMTNISVLQTYSLLYIIKLYNYKEHSVCLKLGNTLNRIYFIIIMIPNTYIKLNL